MYGMAAKTLPKQRLRASNAWWSGIKSLSNQIEGTFAFGCRAQQTTHPATIRLKMITPEKTLPFSGLVVQGKAISSRPTALDDGWAFLEISMCIHENKRHVGVTIL